MSAWRFIILFVYILAMLLITTKAKGYYTDKRVRVQPSFQTAMRYGRSDGNTPKTRPKNNVVVAPRNDRFYLGPRYGKRSSTNPTTIYSDSTSLCGTYQDLSCTYTGVSNLYRCFLSKNDDSVEFSSSK